ncbi:S8 family serine peptidase [Fluviicola taffensis]|uniref:Thermitase n=1 Tax=Fluviicola taffensis (strain DSM 16823 / NCIMB 13979 / RW262) TaxID=755732 RepID=F2IGQ7_FLUTR|nr:S8 family serine peptidase [Fluviicola taffensis]AEA43674.1 Thermitase [Fluviicola taffensis DSM 16823]
MKKLLALLALIPFGIFAQTVHVNYQDGKIWFKLTNEIRISQPLKEDPTKIPVQSIPGLNQIVAKYGFVNLSKPFHAAKTSPVLQRTYLLEFSSIQDVEKCVKDLENLVGVEYAEKVPLDKFCLTPNDPSYSSQWGLTNINAPTAWNYFSTGSNVVIAIVDDAVERTHADLSPNLWVNTGEIAGNNIDDDNNGYIDDINGYDVGSNDNNPNPPSSAYDHGTHVAGISSARSNNGVGVASIGFSCKLMCVKSTTTVGQVTNGYDGIVYAAASGADIINMSWGGPGASTTGQNVVNYAVSQGCILIAASGNDNVNTQFYPAAYNNVVSVAATTSSNTKASFSNYGTWIDISAPGNNIYSTTVGNTYGNKSGTSMASPMVAGLAGLMKSLNPNMPNAALINCLISTAANINAQNPSFIGQLGSGRIDAAAAMACVATSLNNPPVADFSANFTTISAGGSVLFTNLSTYNPTSWNWTFTGGTPATFNGQNPPSITYNTPGTYAVSLTATNANGTDTETKTGYIVVSAAAVCQRINLPTPAGWTGANYYTGATFAANGWINGMNASLDKQKAMYFDASASPNTILNNVYVAFGLAYSANPAKIVPINIYDGTTGTPGALLGSTNLTMGQIMSDVNGNFYTEASFVNNPITLPASKKFFVALGLTNLQWSAGVKDTLSIVSNSNGQTSPSPTWEQQSNNTWYQYGTAGTWNLGVSLFIHPFLTNTPSQAIITPSTLTICAGNSVNFNAAGSTYQDTLLWSFPGGTPTIVPSAPTASVTYGTPGTYNAILYTIGGGCSLFDSAFVSITVSPTPTISVSGDNTICNGASTALTASGSSSLAWSPATGLSATTGSNVTATPTVTTTYSITGTTGSCSNSTTITINVDDPAVATIEFVDSTVACPTSVSFDGSNSTGADSFSWTFPGGIPATSNSSSPTATFQNDGTVIVQLITTNTCGADTTEFPIQITTINCDLGLNDLNIDYIISYNPDQALIHIVSDLGLTTGTNIQLYNEMGQLLISNKLASQVSTVEIPVSSYAAGMYFVRITSDSHEATSKVIKH